jgi:hypothetical protein
MGSTSHPEGSFTSNTFSDLGGFFALGGVTGAGLSVYVGKPGYYTVKTQGKDSFEYSILPGSQPFHPDRSNPILFHLRKKGTGADLVTSQHGVFPELEIEAPRSGSPVYVDLMERKLNYEGQLIIRQTKPEYLEAKKATAWSFHMAIPTGGFVEENDEFPFEAPETGYQPVVEFQFNKGETNWMTSLKKNYYITFGQPQRYGWLTVETRMGWGGAHLTYAINPDGSRYLEPKENQPARRELPPGVTEVIPGTPQ